MLSISITYLMWFEWHNCTNLTTVI